MNRRLFVALLWLSFAAPRTPAADGTLVAWGEDDYGQVSKTPTGRLTAVAAGAGYSGAIRADGTLVSWGNDCCSQVSGTPKGTFRAVAAGWWHSVAIRT